MVDDGVGVLRGGVPALGGRQVGPPVDDSGVEAAQFGDVLGDVFGVAPEVVHGWHECSPTQRRNAAPEYPDPIVDHAEQREAALAMFERARGEAE